MRSPTSMDNNIVPIFQLMCFVKTISESFNVDSLDILCCFQSFPSSFSFPSKQVSTSDQDIREG